MENVTPETILYEIEERIARAKEGKIKLLAEKKETSELNATINSLVLIKSELIRCLDYRYRGTRNKLYRWQQCRYCKSYGEYDA